MLTLYDYLPSQNAYKIRLLLNHLDRPYQSEFVSIFEGEGQHPEFLKINPTGAVPAIKTENGEFLAESNAILVYLAEGTHYLPDDPLAKARVLQWLFFEGELIQAGIATLRHWILTGKDSRRSSELIESKIQLSHKSLRILDNELEHNLFLGGNQYTIADISAFAYVHLAREASLPLDDYSSVVRWVERIQSQDRFLSKTYPYSIDPHSVGEL